MNIIYKEKINIRGKNKATLMLAVGSEVLSCAFQGENLVFWYRCLKGMIHQKEFTFYWYRTGEEMPIDLPPIKFIGTAQDSVESEFPFVVHLFQQL